MLGLATDLASFFVVLLFSLCFHEYAHGWVAKLRGDNTAEISGRLTMNPLAHIDMVGTLILPITAVVLNNLAGIHAPLFGWAKPVPVNERNMKSPRTDMFWVALAGPLSNVLLAVIGVIGLVCLALFYNQIGLSEGLKMFLQQFILTNLFLAFFNIIPLHPLDGGKVIARFLPASLNDKLEQSEQMTSMILLVVIVSGGLKVLAIPVYWAYNFLINVAAGVLA